MVIFSNGKVFEFLAKRRKEFLAKLLKEGLPKNNVIDIMVGKKPDVVHTSTLKKMPINSKTNKPIDPKILAKKTKLKKTLKQMHRSICMNMDTYSCSSCNNKKVTHCLVNGDLVEG